jgi:Ca-activated chloride channel homolog
MNQAGTLRARQLGGQTALYDALVAAAGMLRSRAPARRVLILLSDGEDNYSRGTLAEAMAALQQANIAVYAITVHSARLEYPGDRVLGQLAGATGGRAFLLRNYMGFSRVLTGVEGELRGQYMVGFRPVGGLDAGEFHAVKIVAPGAVIRARSGFYVNTVD